MKFRKGKEVNSQAGISHTKKRLSNDAVGAATALRGALEVDGRVGERRRLAVGHSGAGYKSDEGGEGVHCGVAGVR